VYDDPSNAENVKLAEIPWEFNPPRAQKDAALEVAYEYGDDGILTVQIQDLHTSQKKRFAIQQTGPDQMDAGQIMRMKRINEDLMKKSEEVEKTPEYRDALEILKKTEQDVIPKIEDPADKRELEELCRQVREAMAAGDKQRMEETSAALNDRLLNFAYLL
jgi:molecular chaperone DnaK (HSP70)